MSPKESVPDQPAVAAPPDAALAFHPDPRCHMLVVVLMAGFALRAMNALRARVGSSLSSGLLLLEVATGERNGDADAGVPFLIDRRPRSITGISRATGIPRETARRLLQGLERDGWVVPSGDTKYRATERMAGGFALQDDAAVLAEFAWTGARIEDVLQTAPGAVEGVLARHPWNVAMATRRDTIARTRWHEELVRLQGRLRVLPDAERLRAGSIVDGYVFRHLVRLRRHYDGDLTLPLLVGEIAHRNISTLGYVAEGEPRAQEFDRFVTREGFARTPPYMPVNAYSLAVSMGIPDATVRRKLAKLLERDWVRSGSGGGLTVNAPEVERHAGRLNLESLSDFRATHAALRAAGIALR